MREQTIQSRIKSCLELEFGAYVVKVIQASKAGIPDLLVCFKGKFIAFEIKTPTSMHRVSKLQSYNLRNIQKSQGLAFVVSGVSDVREIMERIKNERV